MRNRVFNIPKPKKINKPASNAKNKIAELEAVIANLNAELLAEKNKNLIKAKKYELTNRQDNLLYETEINYEF